MIVDPSRDSVSTQPRKRALGDGNALSVGERGLHVWALRSQELNWRRPYVMGILNLTPDSFSDGGRWNGVSAGLLRAEELLKQGADIIDVGGESTRPSTTHPSATLVSEEEECRRVLPLIEAITEKLGVSVSIDTTKSSVAVRAIEAGAEIVNDISGGLFDESMASALAASDAYYICGHVRGKNLSEIHTAPEPTLEEVVNELGIRLHTLSPALRSRTMVDPCLGFGKSLPTNLSLLAGAGMLSERLSMPVLIGASRKRFVGELTDLPVDERDAGSVGANLAAVDAGAHMLRVHHVAMCVQALTVYCAVKEAPNG